LGSLCSQQKALDGPEDVRVVQRPQCLASGPRFPGKQKPTKENLGDRERRSTELSLLRFRDIEYVMPSNAILREARKLQDVGVACELSEVLKRPGASYWVEQLNRSDFTILSNEQNVIQRKRLLFLPRFCGLTPSSAAAASPF
jgi:hypothetical protein